MLPAREGVWLRRGAKSHGTIFDSLRLVHPDAPRTPSGHDRSGYSAGALGQSHAYTAAADAAHTRGPRVVSVALAEEQARLQVKGFGRSGGQGRPRRAGRARGPARHPFGALAFGFAGVGSAHKRKTSPGGECAATKFASHSAMTWQCLSVCRRSRQAPYPQPTTPQCAARLSRARSNPSGPSTLPFSTLIVTVPSDWPRALAPARTGHVTVCEMA